MTVPSSPAAVLPSPSPRVTVSSPISEILLPQPEMPSPGLNDSGIELLVGEFEKLNTSYTILRKASLKFPTILNSESLVIMEAKIT